jgi:hypothetical protein
VEHLSKMELWTGKAGYMFVQARLTGPIGLAAMKQRKRPMAKAAIDELLFIELEDISAEILLTVSRQVACCNKAWTFSALRNCFCSLAWPSASIACLNTATIAGSRSW